MPTDRKPDAATLERAAGMLLAAAAGDALGAGYEFGPALPAGTPVHMRGGGQFDWAPGEWTDDTAMALVLADVAAAGADLRTDAALDQVVARWADWARTAKDVGAQTQAVLGDARAAAAAEGLDAPAARHARAAAADQHARTGRSGGNGSLMRTAPLALAYLGDPAGLAEAALAQSALTHHDPEAGEACVLWCLAIRHAVLTGELDARHGLAGLARLDPAVQDRWAARLREAEKVPAEVFENNGWVVNALQAAWSAIIRTPVPPYDPERHLADALRAAVRVGNDTDTVAAIAGALLGACHGAVAVPEDWRKLLHGWPGRRADELVAMARTLAVRSWAPDPDEELFRFPD